MGIETMIGIAGLASSVMGAAKNKGGTPAVQGFDAYPPEVKKYMLETLLPRIQQQGAKPFESIPMQRAQNPTQNIHASPELYKLQQYSDAVGGLFNPIGAGQSQPVAPMAPESQPKSAQAAAQYIQWMLDNGGRAGQSGAQALNTQITNGATDLGQIGEALLGFGYGTNMPASKINFNALYSALGL